MNPTWRLDHVEPIRTDVGRLVRLAAVWVNDNTGDERRVSFHGLDLRFIREKGAA